MRLITVGALALTVGTSYGYLDSQPFFMFSTSELLTTSSKLQTAPAIISDIALSLSQCPSDYYILIEQQGVNAKDYTSRKTSPVLAQKLSTSAQSGVRSNLAVTDVLGPINPSRWIEVLETTCSVKTTEIDASTGELPAKLPLAPALLKVTLPAPSSSDSRTRSSDLAKNDAVFATLLDLLPTQKYTVLYTTTRSQKGRVSIQNHENTLYEMESAVQDTLHMDMKRNLGQLESGEGKSENQTLIDGPLFDRYQFFTPGIFMGFFAGFLLLSILYVAVSALSSLQVTYAAFDKETAASAGKKQQ